MRGNRRTAARVVAAAATGIWLGAATCASAGLAPGQLCEKASATALRHCAKTLGKQTLRCLQESGAACTADDATIADELARLEEKTLDACPSQTVVTAAGYPALLTPSGLVGRLRTACVDANASLAARSFGGPQSAARSGAAEADQQCLDDAFGQGRKVLDYAFVQQSRCLLAEHAGKTCDPAAVSAKISNRLLGAIGAVSKRCADLSSLVAVDAPTFVRRASDQARCLVATAHGDTSPLVLDCGPRSSVPVPPPATPTQIVLDGPTWGTRCGDGSDYAFWLRLAPAGQPLDRIVVFLPGGGSCADGPSCLAQSCDLFESLADTMGQTAINSSSASTNPFRDWTKVFLPYCTQDLHLGGGVVTAYPEMTVYRYGAVDVRAALRYVRDVLWSALDASSPDGFRPDKMTVVFSGSSAGGAGASFHYHYVLDDLRWIHTTLVPDSSLGMDNGTGAAALRGALALQADFPGWNALPYAAPYCFAPECAEIFPVLEQATSARLKAVPEQQILNVDNQVDNVQRNVGEFASTQDFVNTMRTKYCAQQGTAGVHSFLYDSTPWLHGLINSNTDYNGDALGGTLLRDWLGNAMASPDSVTDLVGEGTLETDYPGVQPFPCTLP